MTFRNRIMIELAFVVCLASAPKDCEDRSLLFVDITPMTCMMGAQSELAKWTAEHPHWRIASWKCRMLNLREQEA